jgi:hypothetical protein
VAVLKNQDIKFGKSSSSDPRIAINQFLDQTNPETSALTVFFCSSEFDVGEIGDELSHRGREAQIIGCTSAGEISPAGYSDGTITGFSLPTEGFSSVSVKIEVISEISIGSIQTSVEDLIVKLDKQEPASPDQETFAFLFVDGMAQCEEILASSINSVLDEIPLFGGSASDGLKFEKTHVFHNGEFCTDSAVLTLVRTPHPFHVFKTQHYVGTDKKMVVTDADPQTRVVREINAEPAATEYARIIGLPGEDLSPMDFATHPVVVKVGGTDHVRAIQKVNDDGSLTFFCAIDTGVVLTLAEGIDILENLEDTLSNIKENIGAPQLILGCDCVFRTLELEQKQLKHQAGEIFSEYNVAGFCTYGEQFQSMHVNQTFTGVAIGMPKDK